MFGWRVLTGVAVLVVAGVLVGMAKRKPTIQEWQTERAATGAITVTVSATGAVEALSSVEVGAQISGRIVEVLVEANDRVQKGQTLAKFDMDLLVGERKDREIALEQARGSVELLQAEFANLEIREEGINYNASTKAIYVDRASANLELSRNTLKSYREMLAHSAVPQFQVDSKALDAANSERELNLQRIELRHMETERRQIESDRASLNTKLKKAELDVKQAEQALAQAVTNLGYATIVSPIDGIVLERTVDPGQTIASQFQAPNLFLIVTDLSTIKIRALVDESDIGRITTGQSMSFNVDAFPEETFTGVVKKVCLKSELHGNVVVYPVIIEAPNKTTPKCPHGMLRPGMTAYLTFEVDRRENALRIPATALCFMPPGSAVVKKETVPDDPDKKVAGLAATVHVLAEEGALRAIPIRLGQTDGKFYELLSGAVKAGDEIVFKAK